MNTSPLLSWFMAALLVGTVVGCSSDEVEHPPPLTSDGVDNAVVCDRLSQPQDPPPTTPMGTFLVDGREAGCLADGQQCVLAWPSDQCDAQVAVALCENHQWRLTCWSAPDGGAGKDAGADQDSDTPDGQDDAAGE